MTVNCKWAVIAECEVVNNGKNEKFERVIATFEYPFQGEEFIEKCLPKENKDKFKVVHIDLIK